MTNGDHIQQFGSGSIGKATHHGPGNIVATSNPVDQPNSRSALDDLLKAINDLRQHLDDSRQAEVDAAVQEIDSNSSRSELEGPLAKIAGIAALLGEVGVPVISAIQALVSGFSS